MVGVWIGLVGVWVGLIGVGNRLVDVGLIGVGFGFGLVGVWVGLIGVGDRLVGVGLVGVRIGLIGVGVGSACMLTLICKLFHLAMPHNLNTFHPSNMHIRIFMHVSNIRLGRTVSQIFHFILKNRKLFVIIYNLIF